MTGAFLSALAVILVAVSGLAVAATLRLRDLPRLVLGAYVIGFAEIVVLMLVLSAFGAMTRPAILGGAAAVFAVSVTCWLFLGAPRPQSWPLSLRYLRALRADSLLLALTVVVGLALLYVLALIVGTPPNNWDSMTYHLARAAFWRQGEGIGYISDAYDERLNANPPNGEIVLTFLLEVGRNERLAGSIQFVAALAVAVGVFALALGVGLSRRQAAFGALLFLTLPVVLLQASTTQNDLVSASLLVAAAVFVLGDSRRELGLAALATALALGTKVPAVYGLPVLAAIALVARPGGSRMRRLAALLAGTALGSYWYGVNVVRTGRPLGDLSETSEVTAVLEPTQDVFAAYARLLDSLDVSGAVGADIIVYALVAWAVVVTLLIGAHNGRRRKIVPALLTGTLVLTPLTLVPVGYSLWRGFAKLHDAVEEPDRRLPVTGWEAQTAASESFSWFGPLGLLLVVGVGVATVVLFRRRALSSLAIVLVAAPLAFFVLISVSLAYDPWQGRFFMFPVALSASLWGLILRVQRYAVAAVAIAATSAALSLMHFLEKPSGVALLTRDVPSSVWGMDRWGVQALLRPEVRPVLRFVETEVPSDARLALAIGADDFGYPAFGPGLERNVELIPSGSGARASRAEWLLANSRRAPGIARECWRAVLTTPEGWIGFRRRAGACRS